MDTHLLWEQRVGGSNPLAPTIEKADQIELFAPSEKLAGDAFEGGAFCMARHAVDTGYLPTATPGRFTGAGQPAGFPEAIAPTSLRFAPVGLRSMSQSPQSP